MFLTLQVEGRLYGACVWTAILHGSELSVLKVEDMQRVEEPVRSTG